MHRTRKKELDVEVKRDQLAQLENRIKATVAERIRIEKQTNFEHELDSLQGQIEEIEVYTIS